MSSSTLGQASTSSSNLKSILDAALSRALSHYKDKTGNGLLDHPLAIGMHRCASVDAIKAVFQGQAEAFQQFRDGDQRLMRWITRVVDVLYTVFETLGGMMIPHAKAVFSGISVLLAAAKNAKAGHDVLVELFERIEGFFKRLAVYTQVSLTAEMTEVFVNIMSEALCILSIATREVKRRRAKIYFRKLMGITDIEDSFKRLNNLIEEEVRMAIAQTLRATIERQSDAKQANEAMDIDNVAENIDKISWNQIEEDVRRWLSPPDPSTNHNTACEVSNREPPTWFFEAGPFKDWMSNGSLLWIHGKPGSGKSIVCSAIIQHIMGLRDVRMATLAYFYFDFRDEEKQNVRNLITSLLVQLSTYSKPCCNIIYRLFSAHGKGTLPPSNGILIKDLKLMLSVAIEHPIFIIMDALDECPDSGMPTPREAVLNLIKELVHMRLPTLRICVSSRLETDIQTKLKPLPVAVNAISLHDETRQTILISNYIRSFVSSDEHMMKWRDKDKKLVIKVLSERADGMFQWVFCQLETLRHAVQPDIREILKALPRTLDETYERILRSINEKNRKHAGHLLHCLAVSARPLRVGELAEILTFDFDGAQGGIPKFYSGRRPKDQEEAVLSICSSLISIVDNGDSRMVQFSHLSVKEFLTSNHFASATGDLPLYHILPGPAHTTLAQVCLGLLLNLDGRNYYENVRVSPLAEYAARHWVAHAQFEDVASHVLDGMKTLFDPDKPHFSAWICLFDADAEFGGRLSSETPSPLYYSAFHGFHDLVRYLAIKHPQDVNAFGGSYEFPLFAALRRNHFNVAETLLKHGGNVDVRGKREQTTLHKTIYWHDKLAIEVVQFLLEHGADVNAQRNDLWTPLHLAAYNGNLAVARILLDHGADVNLRNDDDQAPLHLLSGRETFQDEKDVSDIARLLLEHGAKVNEKDQDNATPLHLASYNKRPKIARVLFDHSANADAGKYQGETSMQMILGDILGDGEDSKHHHSQLSKPPLCVLIPPPPPTAPHGRLRSSSEHELSPVRHVAPGASQPIIPIASAAQQTTMSAYHDAEEFQGDTPLQIVLTGLINDSDGENHSQSSPTPPFRTPLYTPPPTATDGHLGSFSERELLPAVPHVAPKATQPIITITSAAQQATTSAYHDAEEFQDDTPLQMALMGLFNDSSGENSSQSSPTPPFRTPLHTPSPTATRGCLGSSSELEPSPAVPHATSKETHPIITITRTAPEATTGASAHLPSVSLGGAPAPARSGPTRFPLDSLTPSFEHPLARAPERLGGHKSDGHGTLTPVSIWWNNLRRKRTLKRTPIIEQAEGYIHTRSRTIEAIGGALGAAAGIGHEALFTGVDLLQFVPVPGLKTAGRILLNIWDAIQMVETNRQASLRLTERCADILISIRGEIADVGYTVAEELRAPIGKLVEAFGEVHRLLGKLGERPFLTRFLKRSEILSGISACDTALNDALGMFDRSIHFRILKLVQASELWRQKETRDPLESISRGSLGLPPPHLPFPPAAFCSPPADPENVRNTLQALRASQNAQDRAHDMADLNQLMSTALAAKDDVAMIEVLQIARSEMPDAIKTLERALKRVVEDGRLDTEDGSTPVPPPHQEAVNGDSPSVDLCDIGASHGSADLLDRKFIESGINALRRLSKVTNISLDLPYWTITWFEIDFEARVGIGLFSDVYRGTWHNQTVAIKVLSETTPRKIFLREVGIWKPLSHPNVLKLFGASSASGDPPWFLVSQYHPRGNLVKYLQGLSDADAASVNALKMIHEISNGMAYLHKKGVLHGDLKAANILVNDDTRCVISDFGQSEMKSEVYRITCTSQPRGTLRWQAPELMRGAQALTQEMDVYAFAICCWEILMMGALPWQFMDDNAVHHSVLNKDMRPPIPPSNLVNDQLMNVIRASWDRAPSNRPSFRQIARELRKQRGTERS